jgi:hypothetical protein
MSPYNHYVFSGIKNNSVYFTQWSGVPPFLSLHPRMGTESASEKFCLKQLRMTGIFKNIIHIDYRTPSPKPLDSAI